MRQQNWDGSMLHDMAGHAAEQELPVMAMCVGAHDDETRLVRAGVSKQARAYRTCIFDRNPFRDDAVPAQVIQQFIRVGTMLPFGSSKDANAILAFGKEWQGEADRPGCLETPIPRDKRAREEVCGCSIGYHQDGSAGVEQSSLRRHQ